MKLALPALDLPISRTGLLVFYPPQFRLSAETGSFHAQDYADPFTAVLTAEIEEPALDSAVPGSGGAMELRSVLQTAPGEAMDESMGLAQKSAAAKQAAQTLVDKFHASEKGSRASGILPVHINLPAFGPSLYLVSELTSENQSPSAEFNYQQDRKAGGK